MTSPKLPSVDAQFYDNTALSTYKDCPRKYFLRHVKGWRSEGVALPLVFGLAWHSGQDGLWKAAKQVSDPAELTRVAMAHFLETWESEGLNSTLDVDMAAAMAPRTPGVAAEMYSHYISQRWKMLQDAELLACEQPFAVPLPKTANVWYIGRLDKVVKWNGETVALEHKTTTAYRKEGGFMNSYLDGWYTDSQIKGYQFGGGLFFPELTQVWVDAALVHRMVHDKFRFVPVAHQFPLLEEWVNDTKEWVVRLQNDQENFQRVGLAPGVFPKNENQCMGKFGPCTFANICRTNSRPDNLPVVPEGYMVEFWKPFELLGIDQLVNKGETT